MLSWVEKGTAGEGRNFSRDWNNGVVSNGVMRLNPILQYSNTPIFLNLDAQHAAVIDVP
jgi:hypothetical protein